MNTAPVGPPRSGCMTAFMILVGIVLLLPGVCVLVIAGEAPNQVQLQAGLIPFFVTVFLAGLGGVVLIWKAIAGPRS